MCQIVAAFYGHRILGQPCLWDRVLLKHSDAVIDIRRIQSYKIKSPPWTILWFRIVGIFYVESINRLGVFMFQTWDNSHLCIDSQYSSQLLTIVWSLKHQNTQHIYNFSRVRVLHLDRLKEGTWLHTFGLNQPHSITLFTFVKCNLSHSVIAENDICNARRWPLLPTFATICHVLRPKSFSVLFLILNFDNYLGLKTPQSYLLL